MCLFQPMLILLLAACSGSGGGRRNSRACVLQCLMLQILARTRQMLFFRSFRSPFAIPEKPPEPKVPRSWRLEGKSATWRKAPQFPDIPSGNGQFPDIPSGNGRFPDILSGNCRPPIPRHFRLGTANSQTFCPGTARSWIAGWTFRPGIDVFSPKTRHSLWGRPAPGYPVPGNRCFLSKMLVNCKCKCSAYIYIGVYNYFKYMCIYIYIYLYIAICLYINIYMHL